MEDKTRNIIIALVVIGVLVGVGIPLGVVMLAPGYGEVEVGVLVTPGAPAGVSEDQIITIGCLAALTEIQGEGTWKGAYLAIDQINSAGGVNVGGTTYYFGLVGEDTFEADANLDTTKGVLAAQKMLTTNEPDVCFGGFRSEALLAYQEPVMDAETVFINVGAATNTFTQNVLDNYDRYKYFFRISPINGSMLVSEMLTFIGYLKAKMEADLGYPITRAAIIREDLVWSAAFAAILPGLYWEVAGIPGLPQLGFEITENIAFPITATAEDFATYWQDIAAAETQLVIPVISAQGGLLMTSQYAQIQPESFIYGINVMSQMSDYWDETGGAAEHGITMDSTVRAPMTSKTYGFWDSFVEAYGIVPIYTSTGGYNTILLLADAYSHMNSLDSDALIAQLESYTKANAFEGTTGYVAFTGSHDIQEGGDFVVAVHTQWQEDPDNPGQGIKIAVSTGGLIYPDTIVTGPMTYPDWDDDGTPDIYM
jgi:branched-chain amino acid transport system substrate-binding protein